MRKRSGIPITSADADGAFCAAPDAAAAGSLRRMFQTGVPVGVYQGAGPVLCHQGRSFVRSRNTVQSERCLAALIAAILQARALGYAVVGLRPRSDTRRPSSAVVRTKSGMRKPACQWLSPLLCPSRYHPAIQLGFVVPPKGCFLFCFPRTAVSAACLF